MLIRNKAELEAAIDHLRSLELSKPHRMEIKKQTRSTEQNRLYWNWINDITTFWTTDCAEPPMLSKSFKKKDGKTYTKCVPWTRDDTHEYFASMLLPAFNVNYSRGDRKRQEVKRQSTATLSAAGMSDYMMRVRQYMLMVYSHNLVTWEGNEFTAYLEKTGGL